jgi:hypothetical protein
VLARERLGAGRVAVGDRLRDRAMVLLRHDEDAKRLGRRGLRVDERARRREWQTAHLRE